MSILRKAWRAIARDANNRSAARQLHAMTDHQLADIGISRDQIDAVVNATPAERRPSQPRPIKRADLLRTIRA